MSRYFDDSIYHHGVKGMRWGVRRCRTARLYSEGAPRKKKTDTKPSTTRRINLTDKQKRALKIGATVIGTAALGYGMYKRHRYRSLGGSVGRERIKRAIKDQVLRNEDVSSRLKADVYRHKVELKEIKRKNKLKKRYGTLTRQDKIREEIMKEKLKSGKEYNRWVDNLNKRNMKKRIKVEERRIKREQLEELQNYLDKKRELDRKRMGAYFDMYERGDGSLTKAGEMAYTVKKKTRKKETS